MRGYFTAAQEKQLNKAKILFEINKETNKLVNKRIDLILEVTDKYSTLLDKLTSRIAYIISLCNIDTIESLTEKELSTMSLYDYVEVLLHELINMKCDFTQLLECEINQDNVVKMFAMCKRLASNIYYDSLIIVNSLGSGVDTELIIEELIYPKLLDNLDIQIEFVDLGNTNIGNLLKIAFTRRNDIQNQLLNIMKRITVRTEDLTKIANKELYESRMCIEGFIDSFIDKLEEYLDEERQKIKMEKLESRFKEYLATLALDEQDIKRYRYIDDYKELSSLAKLKGYIHERDNGGHGIFINEDGKVVVIPQGRTIGKGLSIQIQKSMD